MRQRDLRTRSPGNRLLTLMLQHLRGLKICRWLFFLISDPFIG
jgi:hypothetical protein